jgi:small membrane protein
MLIQFVLIIALVVALFVTWKRAYQNVISRLEAFMWSVAWIVAAGVIILPQTTTTVANFFGVGRGVDFVLYASVITLFFLMFNIFIKLDRLDRKLTDVVRKDALKDVEEKTHE